MWGFLQKETSRIIWWRTYRSTAFDQHFYAVCTDSNKSVFIPFFHSRMCYVDFRTSEEREMFKIANFTNINQCMVINIATVPVGIAISNCHSSIKSNFYHPFYEFLSFYKHKTWNYPFVHTTWFIFISQIFLANFTYKLHKSWHQLCSMVMS